MIECTNSCHPRNRGTVSQVGEEGLFTCKVGRWPKFGNGLTEGNATEILSALHRTLPDVAQKYPGGREHFITLGLNKR